MPEHTEIMKVIEKREVYRNHNLNELFGMMRDFGARLDKLADALQTHMQSEEAGVTRMTASIDDLSERIDAIAKVHEAFPKDEDGERDFRGHRHYHTKLMGDAKEAGKFWSNRKDEIGKMLLYAVMAVLLLGANTYITNQSHNQVTEARK
jgi:hypothetical protein